MRKWQLQEAKSKLSDVVKRAMSEGPQEITLHGKPAVVVIGRDSFDALKSRKGTKANLVDLVLASPLAGLDLKVARNSSSNRDVPALGEEP